ncbi:primosomal protein N' [Cellulomonas sp. KRMCY2]|uniref:primosomal protein N' family DNA-binding protein n=1 Tax=Cellulomonas sp. KRMCY2 TaxID=1304865 RepID=UPI00045EA036|nr:primosomal protein N' [Cellulomonas sp. KRMCY2]
MDTPGTAAAEQLTLAGLPGPRAPRRTRRAEPGPVATELPVARVTVDRPQAHLDRVFEYAVPEALSDAARPGVRVKVRFGGQDLDGYLLERAAEAEHDGELTPVRRVVSPEPVLTPEVLALARAVARRYAGTLADVLRLAVPPRHARVEQEMWSVPPPTDEAPADRIPETVAAPDGWDAYTGGAAFLRRVAAGQDPRAVWQALPGCAGTSWADGLAQAAQAALDGGRGALVVLPSAAEVRLMEQALLRAGIRAWTPGASRGWVRLMADDGPAVRYRSFLAVRRGAADVVIGTRAAAFAPVRRLGLAVCWDDADHLHAEPRAPYPHARDVLAMRADLEHCAVLVGGLIRSVAAQRWVTTGYARALVAPREVVRGRTPRVVALTAVELAAEGPAAAARLPGAAWRAVRDGLTRGPVLIQVPRAGYVPSIACARCRTMARCPGCNGPLHLPASGSTPQCRWCGRLAGDWRCPECSATTLRSVRVGSDRTAEELGRAFPGVPVRISGASAAAGVIAAVGEGPALVVATPGAEPVAAAGYAAALLLDAAVVTGRSSLDVAEQALRTWISAASLVRGASDGGVVLLVGDAAHAPTQALVRWDPAGLAERELAERAELRLPPAVHLVALDGPRDAVEALLARITLPAGSEVLGPHAVEAPNGARPDATRDATGGLAAEPAAAVLPDLLLEPESRRPVRALVRAPWDVAAEVTASIAAAVATRSAKREPGSVRVQVEPVDVL